MTSLLQELQEVGVRVTAFWCVARWPNRHVERLFEFFMLCLVLVFPVLVMTFAYTNICRALWQVRPTQSSQVK